MLSRTRQQLSPKRWLRYVLLACVIGFGLSHIHDLPNWPVRHVAIAGQPGHMPAQDLENLITPYLTEGFFHLDLHALRDELEAQPWVQTASVRRAWPDTVVVQIEEHTPVAQWQQNSLLTTNGSPFQPTAATIPKDLPKLSGPDSERTRVFAFWQRADQQLNDAWRPRYHERTPHIIAVDYSSRHDWRMLLSDQSTIILGRNPDHIPQRLTELAKAYPKLPLTSQRLRSEHPQPRYLDFRYPHGFAVKNLNHLG